MSDVNEIAIRVSNLSKMFRMYAKPADMFWELIAGKARYRPFWALREVSFEVCRGHVVGIMGRNGAGKSTLLKIITGTLDHTEGSISVSGRVSSILELGTGFHGEYSGRENIYLGGLMVGLTREEILNKMDWIIRFSELEEFIDQPFKTYSTGMQARLTFSTAVCIDPDILIIDEALSVGDAKFQRKSFSKIREFREAGRTILLVSHDVNTISTFCDQAILLENGRIIDKGEPQRISKVYYRMLFSSDRDPKNAAKAAGEKPCDIAIEITLESNKIVPEGGHAWKYDLSGHSTMGDSTEGPDRSMLVLYENGTPLRPGHYRHDLIRDYGRGGYSHWGEVLYFSTTDNSDPRSNGRIYCFRFQEADGGTVAKADDQAFDRERLRRRALEKFGHREEPGSPGGRESRMGSGKAEILDFGIRDESGNRTTLLDCGKQYSAFLRAVFYENLEGAVAGFVIRNLKGVDLFGTTTDLLNTPIQSPRRGDILEVRLRMKMWLTNGIFFLTFALADPNAETDVQYDMRYDALQFEVRMREGIFTTSMVNLEPDISFKMVSDFEAGDFQLPCGEGDSFRNGQS